jgi:signal transduction histidine kinase
MASKTDGIGMLEFRVVDTGIGIKNEDLSKLFKMFGKLNSTSDMNQNGVGLGLTISKRLT